MTAEEIEMEDYHKRVVDVFVHKAELDEKLKNLRGFMNKAVYASLPAVEQGLLMVQLVAMDNYSDVLARRIELVE